MLDQFADATRPAADFLHYADGREYPPAQVECLAGRGVAANLAYSAKGLVGGYDLDIGPGEEKAAAVAAWACDVQYPQHPRPPLTGEELGYLYDYFVEFKAPCLEAAGHPQEDAPTREYFVGNWPQQGWYPSASIEQLDSPEWDVIEAACPNAPRGIG